MRLLEWASPFANADDLVRYHDKLRIIDRRLLYVLSFTSPTLISTIVALRPLSPGTPGWSMKR